MINEFLKEIGKNEIIRRYILMNSFDGALTVLGIIFASFFAGVKNPSQIILPSVGAAIAMFVSGIWGAYAAEQAEIKRSTKDLERHLMRKLHGTILFAKKQSAAFLIAFADGLSPLIVALIIIFPFMLANAGYFNILSAYKISAVIVGAIIFLLGVLAGKTAKENLLKSGIKMLFAGVVIAGIFYLLALVGLL